MALPLITIEDFKGRYDIGRNSFNGEGVTDFIDQVTKQFTRDNLGKDVLAGLEAADPIRQKYTDLLSEGYEEVLISQSYAEIVGSYFEASSTGNTRLNNSNAVNIPVAENRSIVYNRYNNGIFIWNDRVLPFLDENSEFEGNIVSSAFVSGTTYTVEVEDNTYLGDGDTVTIGGVDYIISNLSGNFFGINGGSTGLDFTGDKYIYYPFFDFTHRELKTAFL